tara:strand:- start:12117 stop:12467 length:351 start_codon:yes stop_codon:yes gene_type:complete
MKDIDINIKGKKINVYLGDNILSRNKGLKGKVKINKGMLFVYTEKDIRSFWMKDTREDLIIYFINSEGIILEKYKMIKESENIIKSKNKVRYVLEMPANMDISKNLKIGEKIVILH